MAISNDGLLIVRGTSKKGFMSKTTTATIYPDGEMIKDLPESRPDLLELKQRIKKPLEVDYVKLPDDRIRVPKSPATEETDGRADKRREIYDGSQQGRRGAADSSVATVRRHHPPGFSMKRALDAGGAVGATHALPLHSCCQHINRSASSESSLTGVFFRSAVRRRGHLFLRQPVVESDYPR